MANCAIGKEREFAHNAVCPGIDGDIRSLARILWPGRYTLDGVFVALRYASYFDASTHPQPKSIVVAGYASPVWIWERFEIDWRLALAKFDVPYFHMKEFTACRGPFSAPSWKSETKRADFMATLADVTRTSNMIGIARLVSQQVFEKANQKYLLDRRFNPYVICALECALRAKSHIRKLYSDTAPIDYIFDQGDKGAGLLTKEMENRGLPAPIFRHSKPVPGKPEVFPTVQLQCCDFAAWELRKAHVTQDAPEFRKYRKSLEALRDVLVTWKEYTHLEDFCKENGVELRQKKGPSHHSAGA